MPQRNHLIQVWVLAAAALIAAPARAQDDATPAWSFEAAYTGEWLRNTTGGIETGTGYLDNLDLVADADGAQMFGVPGLTLHAHVMYNNGHEFGARYSGEAQLVSNIEGVDTWRLYEMWGDFSFGAKGKTSLRAGLYDLNSEFDALDSASLFINSSHGVAPTLAQTGRNGPSIFPITSFALRLRGEQRSGYWQLAILDAVPGDRNRPDHTGIHLSSDEGALGIAEFGGAVLGFDKLAVGHWRYSAAFDTNNEFTVTGDLQTARGNSGWYLIAERKLLAASGRDLRGFVRLGSAAQRFNVLDRYVGAGLVWRGPLRLRPDDLLGIAVAHAGSGSSARQAAFNNAGPIDGAETAVELTWRAQVSDWLTLQPHIQYVRNPGLQPNLDDTLVAGLRFELNWSRP